MRAFLTAAFVTVAPAVQALEYCEELWFTRNLAFHQAGYCFGSTLGKAVFGNAGCTGTDVALSPAQTELVAQVRAAEAAEGCQVDSSARGLRIRSLSARKSVYDIPMPSLYESACIGWQRQPKSLHVGRNPASAMLGEVRLGDDLLFEFEQAGPWAFVQVLRGGMRVGMGWAEIDINQMDCEAFAG